MKRITKFFEIYETFRNSRKFSQNITKQNGHNETDITKRKRKKNDFFRRAQL